MTYIASTVCTTTDSNPVGLPIGQKSFYAKGYYFIFYANGAYIKYRSSSNGTSWGSEQAVSAMSTSTTNGFAICYDGGDYCYYARCPKDTTTLYYCRGTVNTNGTITWGSEVNTGLGYSNATRVCNIELDSSGYALIGYYRLNYPYVARNGVANSASWSSATTWQLNSSSSSVNYYVQVCPLSSQKWLVIYTGVTNGQIYSRYYNGSTLGSETGITSGSSYYPSATFRWTAVSDRTNDVVYFAENGGPSNYKIFFYKWTTSGWGSVETPRGSSTVAYTATPYLVYNSSEDAVYCFWYTSSVIYHRKRSSAGTWDSSDTTDYSDSNNPAMDYSNNALYPLNGYAVLTYPTGTASPYNIKFYALQVVTIQNKSITDEAFTAEDVSYRNKPSLSIEDVLGASESLSRPLRTMPLSDSIGLGDEMSRPNKKMPLSDVLGLSDTGYRNRTGGLSVSDALALVEALSRPKRTIPFYDTLTGSDVPYRSRTAGLKVNDTLGATTESVTRPKRTIPFTDAVSGSDVLYRNKTSGLKISDSLGYSDSFLTNKSIKVVDVMSSVDSAGPRNKTIPILEALSTGDSALVGKTLKFLDSLALSAESLKKTRKLAPMNDTLSASEIVRANKTLTFNDAFNLFEALYRNRNTKVTDALTLSDILLRAGTVKLSDTLGLADSVITGKNLTMRDTLAITDLALANKRFNPIAESFRVVDSFKRNKRLTLAESLHTIDSLVNNKTLTLIPDSITQTQALKLNKTMKLKDYVNQADSQSTPNKSLLVNDNLDLDDLSLIGKSMKLSDSFSSNDVFLVGKSLKFSDAFSATDVASRVKRSFGLTDSLAANDTVVRTLRQMKIADTLALADALKLNKTLKLAESLGIVDNATIILKGNLIVITDALTASDIAQRTKRTLPILDTMSVADALLVAKKLILSDPFHYTDVMLLKSKALKFSDAVSVTDTLVRGKRLPLADSITSTDSFKTNKTLKTADSVTETDIARRNKIGGLKVNDAFSSVEALKTNKNLKTTDTLSAIEALRRNKNFPISDSLSLTDTNRANKGLIVNDEVDASDSEHTPCVSLDGFDSNGGWIARFVRPSRAITTVSTNFTYEFWVNYSEGYRWEAEKPLLSRNTSGGIIDNVNGAYQHIGIYKGASLQTGLNLTGTRSDRSASFPYSILDSWHHIAISYDGTLPADNLVFYLDGKSFKTFTAPGTLLAGSTLAHFGYYTTYQTIGKLSDIRLWNVTRSEEEIYSSMDKRLSGEEDGLVFYMPLDEGSGTIAHELVSGNNGNIVNASWATPSLIRNKYTDIDDIFDVDDISLANKSLRFNDSLSSSDLVYANKRFTIQDAQHVVDTLFKSAKLTLQDSVHLTEAIHNNKRLKLNDTIGLADSLLVMKHILLYDVATLTEKLTVNKKLTVQEAFALNDLLNTQRHLQILDSFSADDEISQSKLFVHYHRLQAQISTISRALGIDTISNQLEAENEQKTLDGKDSQPDKLQGSDSPNSFPGTP